MCWLVHVYIPLSIHVAFILFFIYFILQHGFLRITCSMTVESPGPYLTVSLLILHVYFTEQRVCG